MQRNVDIVESRRNGPQPSMHYDDDDDDLNLINLTCYECLYRLNGSYEALSGGLMSEALTDVTGGIVERFDLGRKALADLQHIMLTAFKKSSLMGCSIDVIIIYAILIIKIH